MGDVGDIYRLFKKDRQNKRRENIQNAQHILTSNDIAYTSNNGGVHLMVEGTQCIIDFWPSTGRWHARNGIRKFGIKKLLGHIQNNLV